MKTLDIFYNHIIPEAQYGRIDCLSYYNIIFESDLLGKKYPCMIENDDLMIPTLMIKDKSLFDELLVQYVERAKEFYEDENFDDDVIKINDNDKMICKEKVILALLFANATIEDFQDPIGYLHRRIKFFENDYGCKINLGYSEELEANLIIEIEKDIINNETPYQFKIFALDNMDGVYEFPRVKFGIEDNKLYIYAIQNASLKGDSKFEKKINRKLYRVGMGFTEDKDTEENLKDITASFLFSLNIVINYFNNLGICDIVVPSILIERWNAKNISNKYKGTIKNFSSEEMEKLDEKQIYLQYNLTNKLIRTFLRLACHYNNVLVESFPFENDSCLRMKISNDAVVCNNKLLYDGYNLIKNKDSKSR